MDRLTRTHKIWLTLGAVFVAAMAVVVCVAAIPTRAPVSTESVVPAEPVDTEDCDKEDQAKGQWWEGCTIDTKPKVVRTTKPVVVPTPARPLPRTTRQ